MSKFKAKRENGEDAGPQPFAVRVSGRLLMIQAAGLLGLVWFLASNGNELNLIESWEAALWLIIGLYAAVASLNFLRGARGARSQAILVQGFALGLALFIYATQKPTFVYPVLFSSILIVLYMQHPDVRERFPFEVNTREQDLR